MVTGSFTIVCDKCGTRINFDAKDADFQNGQSSERQMGTEHEYAWEDTFECENCNSEIEINYRIWEYPVGVFNYDDIKIERGSLSCKFDVNFMNEPDEPDEI